MVNAIINQKPEKAIEILNEKVIPVNESVLNTLKNAEVMEDDLVTINDMSQEVVQLSLDKHVQLRDIFEKVMTEKGAGNATIVIHAVSDHAIDTEELYGKNGGNFEGNLVVETKKGKQIEYKLSLGENG